MKLIVKSEGSEDELLLYLTNTNHGGVSLVAKELQGDMNLYHIIRITEDKGIILHTGLPDHLGLPLDSNGRLKIT